jgi:hypothetical protein
MSSDDLIALFDEADSLKAYGRALAAIGDSARFSDTERGELARAMARCWGRVAQS